MIPTEPDPTAGERKCGYDDWLDAVRRKAASDALTEAADEVGPALQNEVGGHTSTYAVRHWLRDRAARIAREAR